MRYLSRRIRRRERWSLAALLLGLVLVATAGRASAADEEAARGVRGIDVSRYQGRIDWRDVEDDGVAFAFIKATEGLELVDPMFARNWREARKAGVVRGAYHFFRPNLSPERQARHFLRTVRLTDSDLPPVLDVEVTGGVSTATLRRRVRTWLRIVERETGKRPIVYTNARFGSQRLASGFGRHALWVAHYRPRIPLIPRGWTRWTFWQYSERGRVDGVPSRVDMNRFRGTRADLRRFVQADGHRHH